jgi:hypothetical protein
LQSSTDRQSEDDSRQILQRLGFAIPFALIISSPLSFHLRRYVIYVAGSFTVAELVRVFVRQRHQHHFPLMLLISTPQNQVLWMGELLAILGEWLPSWFNTALRMDLESFCVG